MAEPYGRARRPIFVGGLFKSGTSLTRVLLGQHPNLFASYETYWFDPQVSEHWADRGSKRMSYLCEFYGIDEALHDRFRATKAAEPHREFVDIVLEHASSAAGKHRWVEKTPGNIAHVERIRRTWRDASIVICTREFKDTFASWKARRGNSLEEFIEAARRAYDPLVDRLVAGEPGLLAIDYAALVDDTEATMRRVLAVAGEPWDDRCATIDLDGTGAERERVKEVTGRDNLTSVSLAKPIFRSSVGQWRDILEAREATAIESGLAHLYARLGDRWST